MMTDAQKTLDNITTPVLVAEPVKNEKEEITSFVIAYTNRAMDELSEHSYTKGKSWSDIEDKVPVQLPWYKLLIQTARNQIPQNYTFFSARNNAWYKVDFSLLPDQNISILFTNITAEMTYARKLKEAISKDPLTGLPNRTGFSDDLDICIENCRFQQKYAGVFILDIDNLKNINESSGSKAGDQAIISVAEILKRFERDTIHSYRYGDDEFAVLISNQNYLDAILTISDSIFDCFQMEKIQISGGISIFPFNTEQKEELIRFSNMAVHYSKQNGKNCISIFEPEMQRRFIQKLTIQSKMAAAITECNFVQYYQPQFDVSSGKLRGFEALIRWTDDELGEIPPSVFIPLAEESNLIIPIGRWVLQTAISTLKNWQKKYNFNGIISVNVSPIQLAQEEFIYELQSLIRSNGINPNLVEIEITEGVMLHNMEEAIEKLKAIQDMGVRVSLDDFGTGYSSLSYLQALPLNTLKIDKSFIQDICSSDGIQANITSSIITMVARMGLETIAEGVEDINQFELLSKFHCNVIQGFLQGKPMPFDMCDSFLAGNTKALLKN